MDNNKINEAALTKRLKTLVLQGRYEDALKELEDIDIQRLKNNSILCLVGEVYMGLEEHNEAERVLLRVYEKNPTARRILDLLTTLYIEKGEYSEAEYYYKEFISVASKDLHRYILRYRIDKGKKERLSVLIQTLEKLKEYEYIEEWAYELAKLYDESGQTKKCLHECEEIVLWFGHGEYVDKAIALRCKITGEPLPEMTTVEMYEAEEEKRAQEKQEQEKVYAEISRRSASSVVDGIEEEFDGSIDTEMIQQTLEGRDGETESQKEEVPDAPQAAVSEEKAGMPAEAAEAEESAEHEADEDWLKAEDAEAADEEDDEIVPENALVSSEKEEKESITQIFGNLMSGKLFGKLLQGRKEEPAPEPAEETAPAETEETVSAETEEEPVVTEEQPAVEETTAAEEPETEETEPAEESETGETEPAKESETEETEPAQNEVSSEEEKIDDIEVEDWDEQEDDEILKGELDLSIFEMKADQAFEDSIIENMDASFRASYGENPVTEVQKAEEAAEETMQETADSVEEAEKKAAETEEEAEEAAEVSEKAVEILEEETVEAAEEIEEEAEEADEIVAETESAQQQAVSFAEAITEAVGEPSAFISEQTEDFVPEGEEQEAEAEAEAEAETEPEAEKESETEEESEAEAEAESEPEAETEAEAEAESESEAETGAEAEAESEPEAETGAEAEAESEPEEETEAEAEAESEPEAETGAEAEAEAETESEDEAKAEAEAESEAETEEESETEAEDADNEDDADDEDEVIDEDDADDEDEVIDEDDADDEDEVIDEDDADDADEVIEADDTDDDDEDDEDEIIDEDDLEDEIISDGGEDEFVRSLFAAAPAAVKAAEAVQKEEETIPAPEEEETEDEFSDSLQASDTVMDIFGAVAEVKSIKQQLTETFTKFEFQDNIDLLAPYDINFVVTGDDMSVKSQIAIGIAKALNTYQICDKNKLVRADAKDLNSRDFTSIFPRLKGGCLIIEEADKLNESAVQIISDYIQKGDQDVAIVLEGEEKPLMEMFSRNRLLRQRFLNIIHIGKYNESELVQLATGYAKKKGYEVSPDAAPVLKKLFRERMQKGESVNYEDIIVIVENAISSLERRNMENLFMTVLDNKYEEAAMFLLQSSDFRQQDEESPEEP